MTGPRLGRVRQPAVAGTIVTLLGVVLLGFVAQATLLSHVRHARAQYSANADFVAELARGAAPVSQVDEEGRLFPMGTGVAILEIPSIGVREVVLEGTTSWVTANGPGHRRDTAMPGQPGTSVVMGRRTTYGGPFQDLPLLGSGDKVFVTTGQGRHEYEVIAVRTAGIRLPPPVAPGAGRLTLMTADGEPFLPEDVIRVDADLVSEAKTAPSRPLRASALDEAERVLSGDPDAWVPLVLWAQALLLGALGVTWARLRFGGPRAWIVGVPVLLALGVQTADQIMRLLPNVM